MSKFSLGLEELGARIQPDAVPLTPPTDGALPPVQICPDTGGVIDGSPVTPPPSTAPLQILPTPVNPNTVINPFAPVPPIPVQPPVAPPVNIPD